VFEKPYKTLTNNPNLIRPQNSAVISPERMLVEIKRKFAYNSTVLFYLCCKYNILLTWEMWTIIVSTAITLQPLKLLVQMNMLSTPQWARGESSKLIKTRLWTEKNKYSRKKYLTSTITQPFNHLTRDERKFAESNQAISKRHARVVRDRTGHLW